MRSMPVDLHLTSPLMTGAEVKQVQLKLTSLGFDPGPADGEYGPATAAAVRAFQKATKLEVDGVVGPQTRKALRAKKTAAVARQLAHVKPAVTRQAAGEKALAEATKYLG